MDLTKDYEKLYNHWLQEFQQLDLTILTQEMFYDYTQIVTQINNYQVETNDILKEQLLKSYKDNITFLFNDFLKIRKVKTINSALALKEIDLDKVIEAEKLLFQNLIGAIKGYKKIKAIAIYEEEEKLKSTNLIVPKEDKTAEKHQSDESISQEELTKYKILDEEINYILVRFLKRSPPLVGIDLINYGPFEKEDIVNLPLKNAKILIYEKFAEEIELS
ncbi:hypothetical protein LCGC14_0923850 [marine sediment metagenome]|uniref:Gins51 C-terminal domain-containing protein n=1 Tax=marine sediment metagenome TaxID=412755 RepID=A0A0F9PAN8_9ZZZZ